MTRFFEDRERAAEGIFVHEEELRFLAVRRGLESLALWAAEAMSMDAAATKTYEERVVDAFVSGTPETDVATRVQIDLEHAGKPALSTTVGTTLSQAVADATASLSGTKTHTQHEADALDTWSERHKRHPYWTLSS